MTSKTFTFCEIQTRESPKAYFYLDTIGNLKAGDVVDVPFGAENHIIQGTVTGISEYDAKKVPYPVKCVKRIIRKVPPDEILTEVGDFLMSRDGKVLVKYAGQMRTIVEKQYTTGDQIAGKTDAKITIPDGVEEICARAFANLGTLQEVELPDSLKIIGSEAFGCTGIKRVRIPAGIEHIGYAPFTYVRDGSRGFVEVRDDLVHARMILPQWHPRYYSDGKCVFRHNDDGTQDLLLCFEPGISSYDVPAGTVRISEAAFLGCRRLNTLNLNEGLKTIETDAVQFCSDKMNLIRVPDSVESMANLPFKTWSDEYSDEHSNERINVDFSGGNTHFFWEDNILYQRLDSGELRLIVCNSRQACVAIKDGTTSIASKAFANCDMLRKVILPQTMRNIEDSAFFYCQKLNTVATDPDAPEGAVQLPERMDSIGNGAFAFTGFRDIVISDHVKYIGEYAFSHTRSLKKVVLPACLERIGIDTDTVGNCDIDELESDAATVFYDSLVCCVDFATDNAYFTTRDGALFDKPLTELLYVPDGLKAEQFTVPCSVRDIGTAFAGCSGIGHVILPDGLECIGAGAFRESSICSFTIPQSVTWISEAAFMLSRKVTQVTIYGTPGSVADRVFEDVECVSFFPADVSEELVKIRTKFEYQAFEDHVSITKYIGDEKNIVVPPVIEGKPVIEVRKLHHAVVSVELPDSVTTLGEGVFSGCYHLERIKLPDTLASIPDKMCKGCRSLKEIVIPESVTEIGCGAFSDTGISRLELPPQLKKTPACIASDCDSLQELVLPEGVEELCDGAFYGLRAKRVVIPGTVSRISGRLYADPAADPDAGDDFPYREKTIICVQKGSYADEFFVSYIGDDRNRKNHLIIIYGTGLAGEIGNLSISKF